MNQSRDKMNMEQKAIQKSATQNAAIEEAVSIESSIEICFGPECSDCDGRELFDELKLQGLNVVEGDCRDQCPNAPLVYVNNRMVVYATAERVHNKIRALQLEGQQNR